MTNKRKTLLILGNGFDLAHGLPTKYSHFLEFCIRVEEMEEFILNSDLQVVAAHRKNWYYDLNGHRSLSTDFITVFWKMPYEQYDRKFDEVILDTARLSEMKNLLDDNVWYEYFVELYRSSHMKGENWIDFESEIRFIIKEVDENALSLTDSWDKVIQKAKKSLDDPKLGIFQEKLKFDQYVRRKGWSKGHMNTVKDFREKAFEDLERLTRVLELYLSVFVEKIPIDQKIQEMQWLTPDYVINFNYTDTYERVYGKGEVYYIHGKANVNHSIEDNNMVLGIDEYWIGDEQNEKINFTVFKKFAQRLQKHTGNTSYKYLEEIQKLFKEEGNVWSYYIDKSLEHPDGVSEVYIFGHSLDVTDKDILSRFIGDDATSVVIYCMDKGTEGKMIENTIKLITEKRLLEKANHVPTKLVYLIQRKNA